MVRAVHPRSGRVQEQNIFRGLNLKEFADGGKLFPGPAGVLVIESKGVQKLETAILGHGCPNEILADEGAPILSLLTLLLKSLCFWASRKIKMPMKARISASSPLCLLPSALVYFTISLIMPNINTFKIILR